MPSPRTLRHVRSAVLVWYDRERRELPWRATRDPYAVLVSEVMLQQTQAARVAERYPRFLRRFPTAGSLAAAHPSAVLAEWSGLGYNRRALALQRAAAVVTEQGWPTEVAGLERLPAVGQYTARAVASLAFDQAVGVVDTNVRRWLLRRFGETDAPGPLQALADRLAAVAEDGRAADWTHATMEFGATVCWARAPRCTACPVARGCPSRGRDVPVPVRRQAPLHGTDRAYRGAILRELSATAERALSGATLRGRLDRAATRIGPRLDDGDWERILAALERDRLVHRSPDGIRLGAATIGA